MMLNFQATPDGLNVAAPIDSMSSPPGYYLLFIVNSNGVPSVGAFVNLPVPSAGPSVVVPGVVNLTQGAATTEIVNAGLTLGAVSNASSTTVPAGSVISQNPGAGTLVPAGSAVALVVSSGSAAVGLAVDKVVFSDGIGTRTTPAFSTSNPGEVLVAFAASDGPTSGSQALNVSGAGLTWTLVKRANVQFGTSEIWKATAPGVLTNAVVTSTPAFGGFQQSLTVVTFSGAAGTGSTGSSSGSNGSPAVSLTTMQPGSLVYGVGNDWDNAIARTVGANQVILHQYLGSQGDTFWVQNQIGVVAVAGTQVRLNDTAPTTDRWNFAGVEIVPGGSPPPSVAVPNVVNLTQAAATTAIVNAGLTLGTVSNASSTTVPAGSVISQNPGAGTLVAPGSAVALVVSSGPPPPAVTLASLTLKPTSVKGGDPSTGTVTLSARAPTGGLTVTLSSSDSGIAQVSSSIPVPAGATSATFPVSTLPASSNTKVIISAELANVVKSTTLTVRR